jgi:hypothetical protein
MKLPLLDVAASENRQPVDEPTHFAEKMSP